MDIENMKNIVILKNLPSNMVEEAFIVLKDNIKIHSKELLMDNDIDCSFKDKNTNSKKDGEYIVKEAEMLVTDYVEKIKKIQNKKDKQAYKFIKLLKKMRCYFGKNN